ncbi:MAG: motility associated factor glycosyltransferase family protein [Desulfatibacillum sp.]|nr:motility associated factor glycosyltransferase family protein [Desulfatibacillum sp.]
MNSIFVNNLKKLRERYPEMAHRLAGAGSGNYHLISSPDNGPPNLAWSTPEKNVIFYDDTMAPLLHVKNVFEGASMEKAPFVVLFGVGLGYQLLFLDHLMKDSGRLKRVLVVEKDLECLKMAMEVTDLTGPLENPDIRILCESREDDLFTQVKAAMDNLCYRYFKALRWAPWPASLAIDPEYYDSARKAIADMGDLWIALRGNEPYDTLASYENFFRNLDLYDKSPNLRCVENAFEKKPAIIVATGPSLKKNMHQLKLITNKAVIISVDASLKILHNMGLYPHFATTIERTPGIDKFFIGLKNMEKTIHLVPSFAHPSSVHAHKGPKLFMTRRYKFFLDLGMDQDVLDMGLSTAIAGFELAKLMGCDPIILVGNDLAQDPNGLTHAAGNAFGTKQSTFTGNTFTVPGNLGEDVVTCEIWYKCMKDYEARFATYEGTVINATEGGARIVGTKVMPLAQAIDTYCTEEFGPRDRALSIVSKAKGSNPAKENLHVLKEWKENSETAIARCKQGLEIVGPLLRKLEAMEGDMDFVLRAGVNHAMQSVDSIIADLTMSPFIFSLQEYFHTEIVPLVMEWEVALDRFEDEDWGNAYRLKLAEFFMGAFGQLCLSLNEALEMGERALSQS